eukprot:6537473-Prymnesium_polylepis.1
MGPPAHEFAAARRATIGEAGGEVWPWARRTCGSPPRQRGVPPRRRGTVAYGLWPLVRRKAVFGRYAVLRCLWHE